MTKKTGSAIILCFGSIGVIAIMIYNLFFLFLDESKQALEKRKTEYNVLVEKNNIIVNHILNNLHEKDPVILEMVKDNLIRKEPGAE